MNGGAAESVRCHVGWMTLRVILAAPLFVACASPPRVQPAPVVPGHCTILAPTSPDSLSIYAVSAQPLRRSSVRPLVSAQLYEPLLTVDCDGQLHPGLARSWTLDASRTRVTLALRPDARFSGGEPISAADVVASWRATRPTAGQVSTEWSAFARRLADASTVVDDHTLLVSLPDTDLAVLASPALAVARTDSDSSRLEGSGPYRFGASTASRVRLVPTTDAAAPRLDIYMNAGDARDAIDADADVVITADPAALSYAASVGGHTTIALPWTRTYLLVTPDPIAIPASSFTEAVREDSRRAAQPAWLRGMRQCEFDIVNASPAVQSTHKRRIAYEAGDDVARELAERLVALGVAPAAASMNASDFDDALRSARETAFVIAVPARSLAACVDTQSLFARVPWLAADSASWNGRLTPLIDTRRHAIVRTDRVSATIDWSGTLHFGAPHVP